MGYNELIPSTINTNIIMIITWFLLIPFAFPESFALNYLCNLTGSISGGEFSRDFNLSRWFTKSDLIQKTASSGGYFNTSCTYNSAKTYGMALCLGDISAENCTACVVNATNTLITSHDCGESRSAIIWEPLCVVKYTDFDFVSEVDTDNSFIMWNPNHWANPNNSKKVTKSLMATLIQTAPIAISLKFYASGNAMLHEEAEARVYGMAMCSRGLPRGGCKQCLDLAFGKISIFCETGKGLLVAYGSCSVRYATFDFLND